LEFNILAKQGQVNYWEKPDKQGSPFNRFASIADKASFDKTLPEIKKSNIFQHLWIKGKDAVKVAAPDLP
jgi:hypothetical protein